jgi:hypothetical protein
MVQPRPTRLRLLLGATCVALLGVIYVETSAPGLDLPAHQGAQHGAAAIAGGDEASFAMPPLDSLAEVLRRPLFSASRKAPTAAVAAAADAVSTGFTLVGIVLSPRGNRALVEHGQPSHLDHAREGQELDGWTVEKILRDRVVLRHADERVEVKLKDGPAVAQQQPGVPMPPAVPVQVQGQPAPGVAGVPPGTFPTPHFMGGALNPMQPGQQR